MQQLFATLLGLLLCSQFAVWAQSPGLQVAKQWKLLSYNFESPTQASDPNFYNPQNVLITGIAVTDDRIFIATPKLFSGVSSTVNWVPKGKLGESPQLQAYPDWSFSNTARSNFNCSDLILTSVYRLRIDSCNRLWLLDAGVSRSLEDYEITCPPKILVVDLNTDRVVRRIDFPPEVLRGETLFTNMVIDETTAKSCDDVFVYITDTVEPGIIVYDSSKDVTWRLSHPAMYPDPDFAQSEIHNDRFVLMDGVVGLTFDERNGIVYFQPLATDRVFSVHKNVLRAGPLASGQMLDVKLVGKKSSQGIGLAVSPFDSSLIFSPLTETALASWNPTTNQQSVLAQDRDRLQFVADITTTRSEPGVIYAIASKFHRFFLKNLNANEFNNRIVRLELSGARTGGIKSPLHTLPLSLATAPSAPSAPAAHNSILHYGIYNQHSQSHVHSTQNSPNALQTYFTSPALTTPLTTKTPYKYENAGIINYGVRSPFTALNQGEAFPPSKANRDTYQRSYLDTLVSSPGPTAAAAAASITAPTSYMQRHSGYYYHHH
ncbi:major royal jelly protein 1 [Drosophila nasuta]|uniref:major royal jelly protein 1 n=1 Tax=Drosophila nasuta TaxID=42062 RepID=UPI00295F4460|nr:major royal jelly protein 1 [Drosophila nasuta]